VCWGARKQRGCWGARKQTSNVRLLFSRLQEGCLELLVAGVGLLGSEEDEG